MKWTDQRRQALIAIRRRICETIELYGKPFQPTVEKLASENKGKRGFSKQNIRAIFDRWYEGGRNDADLDPYRTSFFDKSKLLKRHGLTPDEIYRWFKLHGMTIEKWAEENGFKGPTVSLAINGKRIGWKCEEIMDRLAFHIQGSAPNELLEELAAVKKQETALRARRKNLERRIQRAEKRTN